MKTLKTLKTLLVVSILFNGLALLANDGEGTKTTTVSTEKTIQDYFRFPQVLLPKVDVKTNDSKVEVVFTTSENGKVNFVLAKTDNPILKKEIEKQFSNLVLPQLKKDVAHSVVLKFRTV